MQTIQAVKNVIKNRVENGADQIAILGYLYHLLDTSWKAKKRPLRVLINRIEESGINAILNEKPDPSETRQCVVNCDWLPISEMLPLENKRWVSKKAMRETKVFLAEIAEAVDELQKETADENEPNREKLMYLIHCAGELDEMW